jgi:F-type H+-transporting ATPase subunit gamma
MSKINEIKRKKASTGKTAHITHALELVSSSKLAKITEKKLQVEKYADLLSEMIGNLAESCKKEFIDDFITPHQQNKVIGYVVVSTDRGLCGNLNTVLFRKVIEHMQEAQSKKQGIVICTIGNKATEFFEKHDLPVLESYAKPDLSPDTTLSACQKMIYQYTEKNVNTIYVFYNRMISILEQRPVQQQLLPIPKTPRSNQVHNTEYIFEPKREDVIKSLIDRYIRYTVYQAVVEGAASEEAARTMAMKNATENANKIIDALQMSVNKARQADITKELSEIIGGAEAIN